MNKHQSKQGRVILCICVIFAGFIGLAGRTLYLCHFADHVKLEKVSKQYKTNLKVAQYRGNIFDRYGNALAISVQRYSAYIDRTFGPNKSELRKLSKALDIKVSKIQKTIKKKKAFAYLKRKLTPKAHIAVKNLKLKGLKFQIEPHRVYPNGSSGAELLGFVDIDNNGRAGIEKKYNSQLRGQVTKMKPTVDALRRRILLDQKSATPENPGNNIVLSIDQVIQEIAEEALNWGVERSLAKGGWVVVGDPNTGAILAAANYWDDPRKPKKLMRNRAFMDIWEPGSLTKAMLLTGALKNKTVSLNERINCDKGKMKIGKHTISDTHIVKDATISDVIVHSSNICAYKIAEKLGAQKFYEHILDFGLADRKWRFDFPGYTQGRISNYKKWRPIRFANIAFGQGFLTNSIELVRAFSTIANGGKYFNPYLLNQVKTESGSILFQQKPTFTQLFEPEVADKIKGVLELVVQKGSGRNTKMPSVQVAGKTGTAQMADPYKRGYSKDNYLASFFGFTSTKGSPHLTIGVVIDSPGKTPHYGGLWAAPVFKKIAKASLNYLNVLPPTPLNISTKAKIPVKAGG